MPQDLGKRLDVHADFDRPRCERMPKRMKTAVFDVQNFKQMIERPLIRPYLRAVFALAHDDKSPARLPFH